MQQQQQGNWLDQLHGNTNLIVAIAQCLALPLEVVLHRDFGRRFFGMKGAAAAIAILVWPAFFPRSHPGPMLLFLLLFVIALCSARAKAWIRERRGHIGHSRYSGVPVLCRRHPTWSEIKVKRVVEPAAAVVMGVLTVLAFNQALGMFLIVSGICMAISVNAQLAVDRVRKLDLQDALIDAGHLRRSQGRLFH